MARGEGGIEMAKEEKHQRISIARRHQ